MAAKISQKYLYFNMKILLEYHLMYSILYTIIIYCIGSLYAHICIILILHIYSKIVDIISETSKNWTLTQILHELGFTLCTALILSRQSLSSVYTRTQCVKRITVFSTKYRPVSKQHRFDFCDSFVSGMQCKSSRICFLTCTFTIVTCRVFVL